MRGGAGACAGARSPRWCVPEDIGFFEILGQHGPTHRFDHPHVGGAISNARDAKDIPRKKRYEAVSCACNRHVACPSRPGAGVPTRGVGGRGVEGRGGGAGVVYLSLGPWGAIVMGVRRVGCDGVVGRAGRRE